MLISISAPQPSTRKTPTGGTAFLSVCMIRLWIGCARTEDRDDDEKNCLDHFFGLRFVCCVIILMFFDLLILLCRCRKYVGVAPERCKVGYRWSMDYD